MLLRRADLLAGGFLLAFASSPGQTWFIALSGAPLQAELGLSHGGFGGRYALATLASGVLLGWLGAKVDHVPPRAWRSASRSCSGSPASAWRPSATSCCCSWFCSCCGCAARG